MRLVVRYFSLVLEASKQASAKETFEEVEGVVTWGMGKGNSLTTSRAVRHGGPLSSVLVFFQAQ